MTAAIPNSNWTPAPMFTNPCPLKGMEHLYGLIKWNRRIYIAPVLAKYRDKLPERLRNMIVSPEKPATDYFDYDVYNKIISTGVRSEVELRDEIFAEFDRVIEENWNRKPTQNKNNRPSAYMNAFLDEVESLCHKYGYQFYPTIEGWTGRTKDGKFETFGCIGNDEAVKLIYLDGDGRVAPEDEWVLEEEKKDE